MVKNNRSKRYKVTATIDGKRKFFYGKTKVEAEEARAKYLEMIRLAPCLDDSITLGQWLAVWLRGTQSTLSVNTFESYKFELRNYVLPYMAKRKLVGECKIVCVNRYCMNLLYAPYWGKQR